MRIDHRLCRNAAESAWPHARSNRPRVRPKGGCHKTLHVMCLETQDPNAHKQGNVCERQQFTLSIKLSLRLVVHREGEKGRRGLCQEDHCSAICADFVFGLSRSRSQSPTTVLIINHDIRIESRSQYQRSSRGRQFSRRECEPLEFTEIRAILHQGALASCDVANTSLNDGVCAC